MECTLQFLSGEQMKCTGHSLRDIKVQVAQKMQTFFPHIILLDPREESGGAEPLLDDSLPVSSIDAKYLTVVVNGSPTSSTFTEETWKNVFQAHSKVRDSATLRLAQTILSAREDDHSQVILQRAFIDTVRFQNGHAGSSAEDTLIRSRDDHNGRRMAVRAPLLQLATSQPDTESALQVDERLTAAETLIAAGAQVNMMDPLGRTPLIYAVWQGEPRVVDLLFRLGADINMTGDVLGRTPLMRAAWAGNMEVVRTLLNAGADVHHKDPVGRQALTHAVWGGNTSVAQYLVEHGADVNVRDKSGVSALHYVANHGPPIAGALKRRNQPTMQDEEDGYVAVVETLLKHGAKVNVKDDEGNTPLSLAAWNGHERICAVFLRQEGIEVNAENDTGANALIRACYREQIAVVEMLLQDGRSEVERTDDEGYTALMRAASNRHESVVELLIGYGANDARDEHIYSSILSCCATSS